MAGLKGSKYYDVFLDFRLWLSKRGEGEILGEEHFRLLERVDELGSLTLAAEDMDISYRKAWGRIKECEKRLGFILIDTQRGGKEGGHSALTDDGRRLLEGYRKLRREINELVKENVRNFFRSINE